MPGQTQVGGANEWASETSGRMVFVLRYFGPSFLLPVKSAQRVQRLLREGEAECTSADNSIDFMGASASGDVGKSISEDVRYLSEVTA